jgi:undecaprenyl-diphosphatase
VTLLEAAVLGVVQGLTEWLPVSSTAHLILVPWVLGWDAEPAGRVAFNVLVQDGTLLAVLVYFRRDLLGIARAMLDGLRRRAPFGTPEARVGWAIGLATVPAVALALAFEERIEALHASPVVVASVLLGATAVLFVPERAPAARRAAGDLGVRGALLVGLAQAAALVPGVSRSAATIAGGLFAGLDRVAAARFAFLLSVPIMAAAGAWETASLLRSPDPAAQLPALAVGFGTAAVVGYATIHWLLGFLARRPLSAFAWYRIAAGIGLLALALSRAR